jgi:hypothetical protein
MACCRMHFGEEERSESMLGADGSTETREIIHFTRFIWNSYYSFVYIDVQHFPRMALHLDYLFHRPNIHMARYGTTENHCVVVSFH